MGASTPHRPEHPDRVQRGHVEPGTLFAQTGTGPPPRARGIKNKRANRGRHRGGMANISGYSRASRARYQPRSIRRQERVIRRFGGSGGLVVVAPRPLRAFASLCKPCVTHPRRTVRRSWLAAKTDPSLSIFFPRLTDFCCRSRMPGVGGVCECLKIKASCGLEPAEARALVAAALED